MALVLTRRVGESLRIGVEGEIKITVMGNQGKQIRLSIEAPADIPVHREEIFNRIQNEKAGNIGNS